MNSEIATKLSEAAAVEVVDDTTITVDRASSTITVGGLVVTWEPLGGDPDEETIITESPISFSPKLPILGPPKHITLFTAEAIVVGVAVLRQRSLALDPDNRAQMISDHYAMLRVGKPGEWETIATDTELTGTNPERTCWFQDRTGFLSQEPIREAFLLVTGPGLATSAWSITNLDPPEGITSTGDLVEAICGQRPAGY